MLSSFVKKLVNVKVPRIEVFRSFNSGSLKTFFLYLEYLPYTAVWYRGVIRIYAPQYNKITSLRNEMWISPPVPPCIGDLSSLMPRHDAYAMRKNVEIMTK